MPDTSIGAAYHEAGHVVVARVYGLQVAEIWIDEYGGGGGTRIQDPKELSLPINAQIALSLAGGIAQKCFTAPTNTNAMGKDWQTFCEITQNMPSKERFAAKCAGYVLARNIIMKNQDELKRLARFLVEHKRVHIDELRPPLNLTF